MRSHGSHSHTTGARTTGIAALALGFALIAAACSNKKDEDSVGGDRRRRPTAGAGRGRQRRDDDGDRGHRPPVATTTGADDGGAGDRRPTPPGSRRPGDRRQAGRRRRGRGRPTRGRRPRCSATRTASSGPARSSTRSWPFGDDLEVHPFLAESITPNDDYTEWTIKVREGITFTDGTPLNADAVDRQPQPTGTGLLVSARARRHRQGTRPRRTRSQLELKIEKVDDITFTIYTGKNGDPDQPVPWPTSTPTSPASRLHRLADVARRRRGRTPTSATQPVGTGPFIVQSYAPRDRMVVTSNPDYWQKDAEGNQLPYLDEIEFRVIEDSQTAARRCRPATSTSSSTSAGDVDRRLQRRRDDFPMTAAGPATSRRTTCCIDLDQAGPLQDQRVRCALSRRSTARSSSTPLTAASPQPANGLFSPGQEGYLEDNGLPPTRTSTRAKALIDEYEAETGNDVDDQLLGHTPTGTSNEQTAELLQGCWSEIGVDVTDDADRAGPVHHQRPVRRPRLRGLRLAQPRRPLRRPAELLVARSTRRHARRRAVAELRPPQRPDRSTTTSTRPARPPTRPRRKAAAEDDQPGSSPKQCYIIPLV